jgi:hypothetical protein
MYTDTSVDTEAKGEKDGLCNGCNLPNATITFTCGVCRTQLCDTKACRELNGWLQGHCVAVTASGAPSGCRNQVCVVCMYCDAHKDQIPRPPTGFMVGDVVIAHIVMGDPREDDDVKKKLVEFERKWTNEDEAEALASGDAKQWKISRRKIRNANIKARNEFPYGRFEIVDDVIQHQMTTKHDEKGNVTESKTFQIPAGRGVKWLGFLRKGGSLTDRTKGSDYYVDTLVPGMRIQFNRPTDELRNQAREPLKHDTRPELRERIELELAHSGQVTEDKISEEDWQFHYVVGTKKYDVVPVGEEPEDVCNVAYLINSPGFYEKTGELNPEAHCYISHDNKRGFYFGLTKTAEAGTVLRGAYGWEYDQNISKMMDKEAKKLYPNEFK